jgi:hypothetical protein
MTLRPFGPAEDFELAAAWLQRKGHNLSGSRGRSDAGATAHLQPHPQA